MNLVGDDVSSNQGYALAKFERNWHLGTGSRLRFTVGTCSLIINNLQIQFLRRSLIFKK